MPSSIALGSHACWYQALAAGVFSTADIAEMRTVMDRTMPVIPKTALSARSQLSTRPAGRGCLTGAAGLAGGALPRSLGPLVQQHVQADGGSCRAGVDLGQVADLPDDPQAHMGTEPFRQARPGSGQRVRDVPGIADLADDLSGR